MVGRQAARSRQGSASARAFGVRGGRGGSPLILYLDTSALVKLYVQEPGSAQTRARVGVASLVATSRIAYPEARAALARRQREAAIGLRALRRAVSALDRDLARLVLVELSAKVARRAGELAEQRALRGFDAIHLASALEVEDLTGLVPAFWCYDERLGEAAASEGLPTA
jgi:predicted nucleic acid-binding protein